MNIRITFHLICRWQTLVDDPSLTIAEARNPTNGNNELFEMMVNDPNVLGFTGANGAIASMNLGLTQGIHYERVGNARKLAPTEYTFNSRLGFISLRQALNNAEVLAVSYEYTMNGGDVSGRNTFSRWLQRAGCLDAENAEIEHYAIDFEQRCSVTIVAHHDEKRLLDAGVRTE